MSKRILHIDMNSFFASCELMEYDDIFNINLVVGGDPSRRQGIVASPSYKARSYGIKSAMSISDALRLAPDLIIRYSNFELYKKISNELFVYLDSLFENIEQASIDEGYIDITNYIIKYGNEANLAKSLQRKINNKFNLPCSIGIGDNKLQAKMSSNKLKPQGITIVNDNFLEIFGNDDLKNIHMLGKSSQEKYYKQGYKFINDIANEDQEIWLQRRNSLDHYNSAKGFGSDILDANSRNVLKSVGNEYTLSKSIMLEKEVFLEYDKLFDKAYQRLISRNYVAKAIAVKIRYDDFSIKQKSFTFTNYTDDKNLLLQNVHRLILDINSFDKSIRLISVTFQDLLTQKEYHEKYGRYFEPFKEYLNAKSNKK